MSHQLLRLDDIEALEDLGHRYRPVRHRLGITSFGVTAWIGEEEGAPVIGEFDEGSEPAEELFVVVSGRATFEIDGEPVDLTPGAVLRVEPGTPRTAVAAERGTTVLAVDGSPGKAYDATGWEVWAPLAPLYDDGDWDQLVPRLAEVAAANPQYPMLAYNLACAESLSGRTAEAIEHLRQAIEGSEKHRADAREDDDLDALRDHPAFQELVGD